MLIEFQLNQWLGVRAKINHKMGSKLLAIVFDFDRKLELRLQLILLGMVTIPMVVIILIIDTGDFIQFMLNRYLVYC